MLYWKYRQAKEGTVTDGSKSPIGQFQLVLCNGKLQGVSFILYLLAIKYLFLNYLALWIEGDKSDKERGRNRTKHKYLKFLLKCTGSQVSSKFYQEALFSPKFLNFSSVLL